MNVKFSSILFVMIALVAGVSADTISSEGFNNSVVLFSKVGGAFYTGNSASGDLPASSAFASEGTHSVGVSNSTLTLTSSGINTSSYTSVSLSFRLASFSINSSGNGADAGDNVKVEISPDNGTNYYNTLQINGYSNACWHYTTGTGIASATYDGDTNPVTFAPSGGGNRTTDGYSTVVISGLPSVASLKVRITALNNATNERWVIDEFSIQGSSSGPTPTITVTGDFSAFSTVQGTPSTSQSVAVSGENLTANIDVAALDGYEYSTDDSNWSSSLSLASSYDGSVYARLTGATAGTYSGNISFSSTGATTVNKAVSGTVYKQEPSNHVSNFYGDTGSPAYSSIDIIWDDPSSGVIPDGYLVKGSEIGYTSITDPVDGSPEADGALVKNISPGTEYCSFSDLDENTTYYFKIFPFTNSGDQINYKTDGTVPTTDVLTEYGPPEAPTAIAATAVSHEGFTARWNAVDGATSYKIDVLTSQLSPNTINEGFDAGTSAPEGWTFEGVSGTYTTSSNYGVSSPSLKLDESGDSIETPHFSQASQVSYWIKGQGTDASSSLLIEKYDGSSWSELIVLSDLPTTGTTKSHDIESTVTKLRFTYSKSVGNLAFDDVVIDGYTSEISPLASWTDITVNGTLVRVDGLDPSTDYYYVVRAVNANGTSEDSNQIEVSTTAETAGESAGTSIGGETTDILVPPVGILTDVDVTIDPTGTTDDDFSVTVSISGQNLIYTISCSNNLALNGAYLLNHIGPINAPTGVNVSTGTIDAQLSDAEGTYLEISGIAAKGDLVITAEFDQTLPIELSSFTYTINANNMVSLMWITQSETNVSGFRVYRGETDTLAEALLISDLIPASNTSTTQSYVYVDRELCMDGQYYYWLENLDMDGSNGFHGPIMVQYTVNQSGNPDIPLVTGLNRIYPNPFNPTTYISYSLAEDSPVMVEIFNQRGQLVRRIADAPAREGNHRIEWNGTDDNGKPVSTGLYLVRLMAGNQSFVRKAILMK